jgi:hypothetical protein
LPFHKSFVLTGVSFLSWGVQDLFSTPALVLLLCMSSACTKAVANCLIKLKEIVWKLQLFSDVNISFVCSCVKLEAGGSAVGIATGYS